MRVNKKSNAPCWEWTGTKQRTGHGMLFVSTGINVPAHRFSWELHKGPIPEGMQLNHLCNNPSCVNPDHLEPCTGSQNINYAVKTHRKGKLRNDLDTVQLLIKRGFRRTEIARILNVSYDTICNLVKNKTYRACDQKIDAREKTMQNLNTRQFGELHGFTKQAIDYRISHGMLPEAFRNPDGRGWLIPRDTDLNIIRQKKNK